MDPIKFAVEKVVLTLLRVSPDNARQFPDEPRIMELAGDLEENGQILPLIGVRNGEWIDIFDGSARLAAAHIAGFTELSVQICEKTPSRAQVLQLQARNDAHRKNFNPIELSDLFAKIQAETQCTVNDLAKQIGKSQSYVSRILGFQRLCPEVREQLKRGQIDQDKAFTVSQEPDPAQQVQLAKQAGKLSRDQLRNELRKPGQVEAKLTSARLKMPGVDIDLRGAHLDMNCAIGVLSEAVRILKKGQSSGWDLTTQCRVLRDQAKKLPKSANRQLLKGV